MFEEFTPPEKQTYHNTFVRYIYIFTCFLGSLCFVNTLTFGAILYHLYQKIIGFEKDQKPGLNSSGPYTPREAYPNLNDMKATKDLRYYALQLDLELKEFTITTEDGYVLTLHRLIDPKESDEARALKKPVLFQHGLLSCSGAWITPGQNSLPFYFLEQGYDVWLGNNRSWFEAKHEYYEGNLMHSEKYWDWDMRELAYYDLPCILTNVLSHKPNHEKLILIGHSQGCTQTFLMLRNGNLSSYHSKIEYFFPLAPAIFPGKLFHERAFIKFIHKKGRFAYKLLFGCCSFLRNLCLARYHLASTSLFGKLSYIMFKFLFGWTGKKWNPNKKVWHFHFVFNVTYVSTKLMNWWLSYWVEEGFSNQLQSKEAYKTGENFAHTPEPSINEGVEPKKTIEKDDSKTYFPYKEPWFQFSHPKDVIPMFIFTCDLDFLVDGRRLITHMQHYERGYYQIGKNLDVIQLDDYSHLDVVWADDIIGRIGMVIEDKIKSIDSNNEKIVSASVDANIDDEKYPIENPINSSQQPLAVSAN